MGPGASARTEVRGSWGHSKTVWNAGERGPWADWHCTRLTSYANKTGYGDIKVISGGATYNPVQLTATTYGNFDGDGTGTGSDDPQDVAVFNAAFPSDVDDIGTCTPGTDCYNALVDSDCDGDVDCDDRAKLLSNWPNYASVENNSCN